MGSLCSADVTLVRSGGLVLVGPVLVGLVPVGLLALALALALKATHAYKACGSGWHASHPRAAQGTIEAPGRLLHLG